MPVRYLTQAPFIANTDRAWFDFLAARSPQRRVDEVNFWLPKARIPMKQMAPGEPIYFRRKAPDRAIGGYGFFTHFQVLDLHTAWSVFGWKNGDPDRLRTDWNNGHRYYPFDRTKLQQLPKDNALRPSPEALEWHMDNVFLRAG